MKRQQNWKEKARTFETRRFLGERALTSGIKEEDLLSYGMVLDDIKSFGGPPERANIFGVADERNEILTGKIRGMRLYLWRRKELWNRLRWLRGELTRLLINEGWKPTRRRSDGGYKTKQDMTREEIITWRRTQIDRYMKALEEYAPLHRAITNQKRNKAKRAARAKTLKEKRAEEIKAALGRTRRALGK